MLVDLQPLPRFQSSRVRWNNPPGSSEVAIAASQLTLFWPRPNHPLTIPLPAPMEIVAPLVYGNRLLLIGKHELYELNLEPALLAAQRAAAFTP